MLGHSEVPDQGIRGLLAVGRACYQRSPKSATRSENSSPWEDEESRVRTVLVVDDQPVVRKLIRGLLTREGFRVKEASDVALAEKLLAEGSVDLISLDLRMPGRNGAEWLRELRSRGCVLPVLIVSASSASDAELVFGALSAGAQEYFEKESFSRNPRRFTEMVRALTASRSQHGTSGELQESLAPISPSSSLLQARPELILMGASTGGPEALWELLKTFPSKTPPILVVQHTNPFFAPHFAMSIQKSSGLNLGGSVDGEMLREGTVYMAHGDYHLSVEESGGLRRLRHLQTDPILGLRPAVDVLFESAVPLKGYKTSLLLTGMGRDGAQGMKALAESQLAYNMVQSKESCVIDGMPREARRLGAAHFLGNIPMLRQKLEELIRRPKTMI